MNRRFALALSGLLFAWMPAAAQDWPTKTVRIIVPFGPGSTPDMVGRLIADHMQRKLGQPFVIENRPGANTNTGTEMVAKAEPDDYTIGISLGGPLALKSGTTMVHVPYPCSPQAMTAVLRNDAQMGCLPAISVTPLVASGQVRILAISLGRRSTLMPGVPTLKESGIDVEADAWNG